MRVKKLVAFKGREDRGMPGDPEAKSAANAPKGTFHKTRGPCSSSKNGFWKGTKTNR